MRQWGKEDEIDPLGYKKDRSLITATSWHLNREVSNTKMTTDRMSET